MAGASAKTMLIIDSDVRGAMKGLASMNKNLTALRRTAELTAVVFGASKLFGGLAKLAKANAEDSASFGRLTQAVRNTGKAVDRDLSSALEEWIEKQQAATAFSDSDLRNSLSILVTEMGDLEEAQKRAGLAADFARAFDVDLASASKLLGRITEDNIESLARYVPDIREAASGMSQSAAASLLAQRAGIDYGKALALVSAGGDKAESVMTKYGIAVGGSIDEQKAFAILQKRIAGQASTFAKGPAGEAERARNMWHDLGEEVGGLVLPLWTRATGFALKGVKALRRAVQLFSTDTGGPRMTTVRKLWKAMFGQELPDAMGQVIEKFSAISAHVERFMDDVGSAEDPESLLGAVTKLSKGLREDLRGAIDSVGESFDKLGLVGWAAKIAAISLAFQPIGGAALSAITHVAQLGAAISVMAATPVGAVILAIGAVGIAAWQVWETINYVRANWDAFVLALRSGQLNDIPVFGFFFRYAADVWQVIEDVRTSWDTLIRFVQTGQFGGDLPLFAWIRDRALDLLGPLGNVLRMLGAIAQAVGQQAAVPQVAQQFVSAVGGGRAQLTAAPAGAEFLGTRGDGAAIYRLPDGRIVTSGTASLIGGGGGGGVIQAAQGFQGIVRGPQLFLAGEGATPEAVSITPLGRRGAGANPVTVNVNVGSVDSSERVRELEMVLGRTLRLYGTA